jgi:hypothetical protein
MSHDQSRIDEELEVAEAALSDQDDNNESPPADIVTFNELRSCADLYRLASKKKLRLEPEFQREEVWTRADQTRFIDSLAKQLPIPSMCISYDYKTDKREMVDGRQRMSAIVNFLGSPDWRLAKSKDVDPRLSGKTAREIKIENEQLFDRIENTVIAVNIVRCDFSIKSH